MENEKKNQFVNLFLLYNLTSIISFPVRVQNTSATAIDNILMIHHSFNSLSYDRSKASSKASSPHSAIQSFLFQMTVSSPFLKVI